MRLRRTLLGDREFYIYAWPSKGGVIILDHADAIDLEYLGLDPIDLPKKRLFDQVEEDIFCQRLLRLGAKWWESEARFWLFVGVSEGGVEENQALEEGTVTAPTMRERRFVLVGWPSTGGLWVAEFDTPLPGIVEENNLVPFDSVRLRLARTMDERCEILRRHFNATFYEDIRDYKGYAFLNSWEEKETSKLDSDPPNVQAKFSNLGSHEEAPLKIDLLEGFCDDDMGISF